jgi:hypothetical protein
MKNRKWIWILLIFTAAGVLLTAIFRFLTPQTPMVPKTEFISTNTSGGSTTFSNIRFTGSFTAALSQLPIASVRPSQTSLDYVRDSLIEKFNLQQVVGLSSVWQGELYTLAYNPHTDDFTFYSRTEPPYEVPLTDVNQGIETAQQFVRETFPNLQLAPNRETTRYLKGDGQEYEESTREEASGLVVDFTYSIEGVPVYFAHERATVITIFMDSQNTVRNVVFQPYFVDFSASSVQSNLISLETALENINSRSEASIIAAYEEVEATGFALDQIVSGELKTATLEYRADLDTGVVYPFYRFTGELINTLGKTIQAEVITPAIVTISSQ